MARKPTDTVKLQLRLSEALRRRLEREAAHNERSMNAEIIQRLEQSFHLADQATAIDEAVERAIAKYASKKIEE